MTWTINLTALIVLTTLTGSILLVFWYWIGKALERIGYLNISFRFLQLVLCFFIFPLAFLVLYVQRTENRIGNGSLFIQTGSLILGSRVFCALWILGVLFFGVLYAGKAWKLHRTYRDRMPCDSEVQDFFERVCEELHIKPGRVQLYQSYHARISVFMGIRRPAVILPVAVYTEEELRVMFVHELIHYRQKDIWMKNAVAAVLVLQFFNPLVWWLSALLKRFCEHACDDRASGLAGGPKIYFTVIAHLIPCLGDAAEDPQQDDHELIEWIKHMKKNKRVKRKPAWMAAVLCAVMAMSSSAMVFAAASGAVGQYEKLYEDTLVNEVEADRANTLEEHTDSGAADGIEIVWGDDFASYATADTFSWAVRSNAMFTTGAFSASSGQDILVTVAAEPDNKTLKVGIIEPDGTRRYVASSGDIYHKFVLDQTGRYRVFVENDNSVVVNVVGSYIVQ